MWKPILDEVIKERMKYSEKKTMVSAVTNNYSDAVATPLSWGPKTFSLSPPTTSTKLPSTIN